MGVTKPYKFICLRDIHGPKPYNSIGFRSAFISLTPVVQPRSARLGPAATRRPLKPQNKRKRARATPNATNATQGYQPLKPQNIGLGLPVGLPPPSRKTKGTGLGQRTKREPKKNDQNRENPQKLKDPAPPYRAPGEARGPRFRSKTQVTPLPHGPFKRAL